LPKNKNHELDKARFDEPLFKNYDLYENNTGPGAGLYQNMSKYKSVADFLKKKRKRNKGKKKAALRIKILKAILKQAIDFPLDESIKNPITPDESGIIQVSLPFGGIADEYLPFNDQEDKSPDKLDFGRDYQNDESDPKNIEEKLEKVIRPTQTPLLGLPDGMDPAELDADKTISDRSADYGITDSGNTLFDNISF
jgi:hypothetical protein